MQIAYVHAYGNANTPSRPEERYKIGSVSKQFMGMAILPLVQDGKLSLDDPVGRDLPTLTRSRSHPARSPHTSLSGFLSPRCHVAPFMTQKVTADEIIDRWAVPAKPLI